MKNKKVNQRNQKPVLRFSPTAWAKLLFCRDVTDIRATVHIVPRRITRLCRKVKKVFAAVVMPRQE